MKYLHGLKCRIQRMLKRRKKKGYPLRRVPTPYPTSQVTNITSSGKQLWTD